MRGFKAKTLRRIASAITQIKHPNEESGYKYQDPKIHCHRKEYSVFDTDGSIKKVPYFVTGTITRADHHFVRLYKHMKRDMANGGT